MKVFVAGATGALGRRLVPRLVARGHDVTGMTRTPHKETLLRELGATPVVADALDPDAVAAAVAAAEPDVIVHQLTALSGSLDLRRIERTFALTNRLRTEGTDNLLAAGRAVGASRFVAQSFAGWPSARTGGPVKNEEDPLDPDPPSQLRTTLGAIAHLERAVTSADWTEGIVLRYGGFYGPGTSLATEPEGEQLTLVRERKFPLVGGGHGVWSLIHIDDAAAATEVAVERGRGGLYNVVDDDPAEVRGVATGPGGRGRREAAAAAAPVAGPDRGRRGGDGDDDREPRGVERQGQARVRVGAALRQLAARVRGGPGMNGAPPDLLEDLRPAAFGIAYRMLGSVSEAEDIAQEALVAFDEAMADGERIESPRAFLATVTTRLAIDELRSARARRERYVGEWLPEPLLSTTDDDPARHAELADSLSLAFLVLLETLSPEQRAALLLHDVFDYRYDEIARIVGKSAAAARQLASRARRHVDERVPAFRSRPSVRRSWADASWPPPARARWQSSRRCSPRTWSCTATAAARRLRSRDRSAAGHGWPARSRPGCGTPARLEIEMRPVEVNGRPGILGLDSEGRIVFVMALEVGETVIESIHSVVNPDKLRHLDPGV